MQIGARFHRRYPIRYIFFANRYPVPSIWAPSMEPGTGLYFFKLPKVQFEKRCKSIRCNFFQIGARFHQFEHRRWNRAPVCIFLNYPGYLLDVSVFSKRRSHWRTTIPFSTSDPIQHRWSHSAPEGMKSVPYDPIQHHMLVVRDYPIQHRPANFWSGFWHRNHLIRAVKTGWKERFLLSLSFRLWNERKKLTARIWEPFLWIFGRCWMVPYDSAPVLNGTVPFSTSRPTVLLPSIQVSDQWY